MDNFPILVLKEIHFTMERDEFERLRDLPNKIISDNIDLQRNKNLSPLLVTYVQIANSAGVEARLKIELNEKTDSKTLNVDIPGIGPICRLDIDGRKHKTNSRSHKHSLQETDCPHPSVNLGRHVVDRDDLSGKSIKEVFTDFCQKANINHTGTFKVLGE